MGVYLWPVTLSETQAKAGIPEGTFTLVKHDFLEETCEIGRSIIPIHNVVAINFRLQHLCDFLKRSTNAWGNKMNS